MRKDWVRGDVRPTRWSDEHFRNGEYPDESKYPYCKEHNLVGGACIWGAWNEDEDLGDLEREALSAAGETGEAAFDDLKAFRDASTSPALLRAFPPDAVGLIS